MTFFLASQSAELVGTSGLSCDKESDMSSSWHGGELVGDPRFE